MVCGIVAQKHPEAAVKILRKYVRSVCDDDDAIPNDSPSSSIGRRRRGGLMTAPPGVVKTANEISNNENNALN